MDTNELLGQLDARLSRNLRWLASNGIYRRVGVGIKVSNPSIGGEWVVILLAALCYKIGDKSRELWAS